MTRLLAAFLLVSAQDPKRPDLLYKEDLGVSVQKPAKKEEWEFKTSGGKLTNAQMIVSHRIENLSVEFLVQQTPAPGGPPQFEARHAKEIVDNEWSGIAKNENFSDVQQKKLVEGALPGGAAGGVKAWYLEFTTKDKNGNNPHEWRMFCWVGKENRCLYRVIVLGAPGVYEKNKKDVHYILSTIKTWKLPKK